MTCLLLLLLLLATTAPARTPVALYDGWAAVRDDAPARCYAIARPFAVSRGAANAAFVTVTRWPGTTARAQLHLRLSRPRGREAPVRLSIDRRAIFLGARAVDAWARSDAADVAIVAAMRGATILKVESVTPEGRPFRDVYRLAGAASAIDAAALACLDRQR